MGYVILAAVAVIFLVGWLKNKVSVLTICYYLQIKNYAPPSDEEMKECSAAVIDHLFKRQGKTGF